MVWQALEAASQLESEGISARVINMHTIKPLDEDAILKAAQETGAIVTAEEHQINGGLGDAVANVVVRHAPVPMEMVAVMDKFGESGTAMQLLQKYGLTAARIVEKAKSVLKRKTLAAS
jgi:transketolase